ncbi:S-adenosyl-L-methionine-dependent methyltransferase, putative [Plasmodium vivax]|uniref:S-adenosyl-L-methionine-dependent methyltransferase, putative n=1 Tax=Plasmodium vivax TaxID=5855 RepID=A0A1G4H9K6_PLAVI|nr:S-adenosyl-L-methionine-dependent methyltransferase, putative [Plasmodium vivax]
MSFIYRRAAQMLSRCAQGGGIKEVLHEKEDPSIRKLYFILHKALEDLDILNRVYAEHLAKCCKNKFLGIVLLCVLVQRSKIDGGGKLKREILKRQKEILLLYNRLKEKKESSKQTVKGKQLAKYFIIHNQDRDSDVLKELKEVLPVEEDEDVEGLYRIESDKLSTLIATPTYQQQNVRIIDKTSCLVVQAGQIKQGMVIVDVCSAPGSKAIFTLTLLKEKGYLVCIEKDKKRCLTLLQEIMKQNQEYEGIYLDDQFSEENKIALTERSFFANGSGTNVYYIKHRGGEMVIKIFNEDFFQLSADQFASLGRVDVVFVDPSCSSSGMPDFAHKESLRRVFLRGGERGKDQPHGEEGAVDGRHGEEGAVDGRHGEEGAVDRGHSEEGAVDRGHSEEAATDGPPPARDFHDDVAEGRIPKVPPPLRDKVDRLAEFQKKILNHALATLKTADTFVYSTCSFFGEENEEVVESVLQSNPGFCLEKAGKEKFLFNGGGVSVVSSQCVRTFPALHACRGIFVSKLRRRGSSEGSPPASIVSEAP